MGTVSKRLLPLYLLKTPVHLTMKFLILAAILGFTSALNLRTPTCDECKTAIADLHAHLLSEESMAEQIAILIAAGCPTQPDPAQCEADVAKYWPGIATATYGFFFTEKEPCGEMGLNVCKREWTCDDCTGALTLLAGIMTQEEYVQEAITFLQGPGYCGDGGEHMENCEEAIATNLGMALEILSQSIVAQAVEHCQEILGVC